MDTPVLEVPSHVRTPRELRAWQVETRRRHGSFRHLTPASAVASERAMMAPARAGGGLPWVELPPEIAAYESTLRAHVAARAPATAEREAEYRATVERLSAFDDETFVAVGLFRRRRTLMDMDRPDSAPARRVAGLLAAAPVESVVTRGLMSSPCSICVPAAGGEFPTRESCEAACGAVPVPCPCFPSPPTDLTATISNVSGCACADGETLVLTDAGGGHTGSEPVFCGGGMRQLDLTLRCDGDVYVLDWSFADDGPPCGGQSGSAAVLSDPIPTCDPFSMAFEFSFDAACCNGAGTSTIRVSITP